MRFKLSAARAYYTVLEHFKDFNFSLLFLKICIHIYWWISGRHSHEFISSFIFYNKFLDNFWTW